MPQSDMTIADQPGASFLSDLNSVLAALATNSSGATEPATTYAFQVWADTTADRLKIRNAANNAWISWMVLSTGAPVSGVSAGPITTSGLTQAAARILGRSTAGTGGVEEISLGARLVLSGGVLDAVAPNTPTLSAAIAVTGTAVDVTTGFSSWMNEHTINFVGVAGSTTSNFLLQLRSGGTFVTSGYKSSNSSGSGGVTSNTITNAHFLAGNVGAGATFRGRLVLGRHPGNIWVGTSQLTSESSAGFYIGTSEVTLAGDLDGFRLSTTGGFSAGSISHIGRE